MDQATTSHQTAYQYTTPYPQATSNQQPYAPAPAAPSRQGNGDALAITSFVLGIVSIVSGYVFFIPILGLIFGIMAKNRYTSNPALMKWGIGLNAAILVFWALIGIVLGGLAILGFFGAVAFG